MFESGLNEIKDLLSTFLGEPKVCDGGSQVQFCCPCCAERKGVERDNKFNLECNVEKGIYHCWVCGDTDSMTGKISGLIKKYGNNEILKNYYAIIKEIKESSLYSLYGNGKFDDDFVDDFVEITLPIDFRPITLSDKYALPAYEYLKKRGLGEFFVKNFNIGYIGWSKESSLRNRIVIPSYNQYGELNYWVGRDYTGNDKRLRYKNPDIKKTEFIFNEKHINWYDNITLVEGVFDHIVVPNSIPLLGKSLKTDYVLYSALVKNAKANVNVFLDDDAITDAIEIYKRLNNSELKNRVRLIRSPKGYDPSKIYEIYGIRGIINILRKTEQLSEYDLQFSSF